MVRRAPPLRRVNRQIEANLTAASGTKIKLKDIILDHREYFLSHPPSLPCLPHGSTASSTRSRGIRGISTNDGVGVLTKLMSMQHTMNPQNTSTSQLLRSAALCLALLGSAAAAADGSSVGLRSCARSHEVYMRSPSPPPSGETLLSGPSTLRSMHDKYPAVSGRSKKWAFQLTVDEVSCTEERQSLRVHV